MMGLSDIGHEDGDASASSFDFAATLEAARGGSRASLDLLFRAFYPRTREMVHRSLATDLRRNRPWLTIRFSTGDIVQEVFRSVLMDLDAFEGSTEDGFRGYLAMVCRNRILDAIRFHQAEKRDGREGHVPIEEHDAIEEDHPELIATRGEDRVRFHRAVNELTDREQLLVRARLEQGETFVKLAEQLGYSSPSLARRAFYAAQARLAIRLAAADDSSGA